MSHRQLVSVWALLYVLVLVLGTKSQSLQSMVPGPQERRYTALM